ncbi:alpha/beta hydrolase [Gracilibacillus xinjiangensis]|uniref:Alpha/beta hydrolase n=1 Tax=Gracilibacillus xinjiangensis TaxID=1193282 RepID=A0ABV8X0G8_9BACI
MKKSKWLEMSDQTSVYLRIWDPTEKPRAIVQIAHGMAEHVERYNNLAKFLNKQNIAVYGNDHRGHGQTGARQNMMGFFSNENGFDRTVLDLIEVTTYIQRQYPNIPIILLGHSMGSFLARRYLTLHHQINLSGAILIGTGYQAMPLLKAGKMLVKTISKIKGKTATGKFLNKMTFKQYNKKTEKETDFDWICSNNEVVKDYMNDPYCGFIPTNQFFYDLYEGIEKVQQKQAINQINKKIPLLLLTGEDDPVTNYGKGMEAVVQLYRFYNIETIEKKIYPNMRHEIINEDNQIAYKDIINWINKQIPCQSGVQSL